MENVYTTPLKYKNFNGQQKTTKLNFHLTPREFVDWMLLHWDEAQKLMSFFEEFTAKAEADPEGDMEEKDKRSLLIFIKTLAELSYGVPDEDGEVFDKSELGTFIHSAKYDAFRLFLFTHPKELNQFASTLLSEDVMKEFSDVVAAAEADDAEEESKPALKSVPKEKDPEKMTKAELLEAFKRKNQPAPVN